MKFCHHLLTLKLLQACMSFFLLNTKEDILKNNWTSIVFLFLLWKSMVPNNRLVPIVLQNIFLCVQLKKETHTGLQQLEGE